ncbi:hypothetical protein BDA96_02G310800 [Sorghum bicolor]|uniref:RBR-type E3 ubiquitin transferase n=2 Tax=Sorghum bicolor TaxID=4558 RepID=A0A921RSD6_SORBI|nr:probable E3 ubiquitin-protein ligase ARI7 [Sorghum bicolor]KAG0544836.1 hypothetical protein BDA96_02G310800 [Sorghum bicolor]KXG36175.1 hypothetical protein SORBI_3002G295200 [Sorghum bicolor]|eukprot:XP_002462827.2 probable E3 ubiquitin-protein ligase ARI7 [Sorghum bicolor]
MKYYYSDGEESYNSYDDDDSENYSSSVEDDAMDEDESCQSDGDDVGGDVVSDNDDDMPQAAERNDKGYIFETEADVRKRQDEVTASVSELLSVPWGLAAVFLRHCRWDAERLENEWFADERRVREAVGLTAEQGDAATSVNDRPLTCAICFDVHSAGEMISAGCAHYYCRECWGGYIHAAVGDGARCLVLRCPDPSCGAPVTRELVREVFAAGEDDDDDRARYEAFVVRSYVEEGTSKYVRWCPGPGCTLAVRAEPGSAPYEVACCKCRHVFCFRCGEEAHRPASCGTAREWVTKNSSDGENDNWVVANTKHCPSCRVAIEKNQGCNHMTCAAPCLHQFCWICLGAWSEHGGNYYHCNRYVAHAPENAREEERREHAKASLERYIHFYERWAAHGSSMKKAREDLERLEGGALAGFAEANGVSQAELGCLEEALALIMESRRVLRWTYPFVYYMDPVRDGKKIELCEHIQGEAEDSLEKLHKCVESEWDELKVTAAAPGAEFDAATAAVFAAAFKEYMLKLFVLNTATRNHLKMLVEGFESGLPEFEGTL